MTLWAWVTVDDGTLANAADEFDVWAYAHDMLMARLAREVPGPVTSVRCTRTRIRPVYWWLRGGEMLSYEPCRVDHPEATGWQLTYFAEETR